MDIKSQTSTQSNSLGVKVSVIVPVFNMEAYLEPCLKSLVLQTLQEIEIIVINDGSTDGSQGIIDEFSHNHPDKIRTFTKPNGGIADTRNFGLRRISGKYFTFLDSDDTAEPDMLEALYLKAEQSGADLVFSDFWWTWPHKERRSSDGPYSDNRDMLTRMFATLWNKLYRTDFIHSLDITFPTGYRYEDASFLYKTAPYVKHWAYVPKAYVHYLQREGSITHNHNERVKDMIHVFEDLLDYYHRKGLYEQYAPELEYLFIRFFLGNSFKRSCQIKDPEDRKLTLELSLSILVDNFPNWKSNGYIRRFSPKNLYFRSITPWSYWLYSKIFHIVAIWRS